MYLIVIFKLIDLSIIVFIWNAISSILPDLLWDLNHKEAYVKRQDQVSGAEGSSPWHSLYCVRVRIFGALIDGVLVALPDVGGLLFITFLVLK